MSRQKKLKFKGQPAPRWPVFMANAVARIVERGGFSAYSKAQPGPGMGEPVEQIAAEIVRGGEGEAFLKAVRRGRSTQRQNLRYQLLREVERQIGASVPRRREDRNTPEAQPPLRVLKLVSAERPE